MRLVKFSTTSDPTPRVGLLETEQVIPIASGRDCLSTILHAGNVPHKIHQLLATADPAVELSSIQLHAPLDKQEVSGHGRHVRTKQASSSGGIPKPALHSTTRSTGLRGPSYS